jgi:hypothetical protein
MEIVVMSHLALILFNAWLLVPLAVLAMMLRRMSLVSSCCLSTLLFRLAYSLRRRSL